MKFTILAPVMGKVCSEVGWVEVLPLGIVLAALLACASATQEQLKTRASFDLNCPESQLQIVELDSKTSGVYGCNQRVTYVEACDGPPDNALTKCTWVLNSDSRRAQK